MKKIININDLDWNSNEHGNFVYEDKWLAESVGGEKLGASLYRLMPGKKAFPFHFHFGNEEAIFVLEGCGTLRLKDELHPIKQGDYISFPVGPDYAHQIINTSNEPLLYLCFSTMIYPDVVEFPDSKKVSITTRMIPNRHDEQSLVRTRFKKKDAVDYYEDET